MKVTITFRHLEHTPSLDERISEKSEKLNKYLGGRSHIKWGCHVKNGIHYAEVELLGPKFKYHATGKSDNLYKTIDLVSDRTKPKYYVKR